MPDLMALSVRHRQPGARNARPVDRRRWARSLSGPARLSVLSVGGRLSFLSVGSLLSAASLFSIASFGSILSIGSSGSILSIGSAGSILSIGSAGSIGSIGRAGAILGRQRGPSTYRSGELAGEPYQDLWIAGRGEERGVPSWLSKTSGG